MMKKIAIITAICSISAQAYASPYVAGRIGLADMIVDTNQYMYYSPESYKSTVVNGKIDDINAVYRAALGYDFGSFRIEAEYGYARYAISGHWALNTKNEVPEQLPPHISYPSTYTLTDSMHTIMANAYSNLFVFGQRYANAMYTDINTVRPSYHNSVFLMAGVGMVHAKEHGRVDIDTTMAWGGDGKRIDAHKTFNRFAYAIGVGLSLGVSEAASVDLAYKYMNLGGYEISETRRDYSSHDITLGLRYAF